VRGGETKCLGRKNIEECGGGEGLNPISWWDTSLKQERANDIIDGMDNAFTFSILR